MVELTINANRAARDQINRSSHFLVNWSADDILLFFFKACSEAYSFIINVAFGTIIAIENVSNMLIWSRNFQIIFKNTSRKRLTHFWLKAHAT